MNEKHLDALNVKKHLPRIAFLSIVLSASLLVIFLVFPLLKKDKVTWNSGPISNPHKMLEQNCATCHNDGFTPVQDTSCLQCHLVSDHIDKEQWSHHTEERCATCHMEHNGDGIIAHESEMCTDCHGEISTRFPESELTDISNFADHPEIQAKSDPTEIKLNHKVHLMAGLAGPDGPTTLQCNDCHRFDPAVGIIEPISFEKDCKSCHKLEFDQRLPGNEVPHGDPDTVYNYLYAEYAKLFLIDKEQNAPQAPGRIKPGVKREQNETEVEFTRRAVILESRQAEEQLFTRTACHLCHNSELRDLSPDEANESDDSLYTIKDPEIPSRWMPDALFDHGAHQEIKCLSCHNGVTSSENTSDVLLPELEACVACHNDSDGALFKVRGKVHSDCVLCHSYHDPLHLAEGEKRSIEEWIPR